MRARAIWEEVVKGIAPSATALMERIDDLCDPERIEDANMLEEMRERVSPEREIEPHFEKNSIDGGVVAVILFK